MILLWKVPTRRSFFKWRVCRPSAWLRGPKSSPPMFDVWILLLSAKQTNEYVISAERFSQYLHTYLLCIVTSRSDLIRWCSLSIVRYLPTYLPTYLHSKWLLCSHLIVLRPIFIAEKVVPPGDIKFQPSFAEIAFDISDKDFPKPVFEKERKTDRKSYNKTEKKERICYCTRNLWEGLQMLER